MERNKLESFLNIKARGETLLQNISSNFKHQRNKTRYSVEKTRHSVDKKILPKIYRNSIEERKNNISETSCIDTLHCYPQVAVLVPPSKTLDSTSSPCSKASKFTRKDIGLMLVVNAPDLYYSFKTSKVSLTTTEKTKLQRIKAERVALKLARVFHRINTKIKLGFVGLILIFQNAFHYYCVQSIDHDFVKILLEYLFGFYHGCRIKMMACEIMRNFYALAQFLFKAYDYSLLHFFEHFCSYQDYFQDRKENPRIAQNILYQHAKVKVKQLEKENQLTFSLKTQDNIRSNPSRQQKLSIIDNIHSTRHDTQTEKDLSINSKEGKKSNHHCHENSSGTCQDFINIRLTDRLEKFSVKIDNLKEHVKEQAQIINALRQEVADLTNQKHELEDFVFKYKQSTTNDHEFLINGQSLAKSQFVTKAPLFKSGKRSSITRSIQNSKILSMAIIDEKSQSMSKDYNEVSLQKIPQRSKLFERRIPIPDQASYYDVAEDEMSRAFESIQNSSNSSKLAKPPIFPKFTDRNKTSLIYENNSTYQDRIEVPRINQPVANKSSTIISNLNNSLRTYLFPDTESDFKSAVTQTENPQSDSKKQSLQTPFDFKKMSEDPGQMTIMLRLMDLFVNYDFIYSKKTYAPHFNNIFNKTFITKVGKMINDFQHREGRPSVVDKKIYDTSLKILEKFAITMNDKPFNEMCYILGKITRV